MATIKELGAKIAALEAAGVDATDERAELAALQAKAPKTTTPRPAAPAEVALPALDKLFIPLNLESFRTGGGGWIAPATTGWKDAICTGFMIPNFVQDQCWFTYQNTQDADEQFRGALVTAALSGEPGVGGAWKVKDVLTAMEIPYEEDEDRGGVQLLKSPKGRRCQVFYDDIVIKGKTERRIQDIQTGVEAAI